MKKTIFSALAFALVWVAVMVATPERAAAIPAFSQQTGQSCQACHFAIMPRLNAEGHRFRMNSFRDVGEQGLMEDESLSLPVDLNASLRLRVHISNGTAKDQDGNVLSSGGVIEMPEVGGISKPPGVQAPELADMFIAGHLGKHMGAITEINLLNGKVDIDHLKLAYVWDTSLGPVALAGGFSRTNGATYVFNDPSNAVSPNLRGWQHAFVALDASGEGVMSGRIGGAGIYAHLYDLIYVAVAGISPEIGTRGGATDLRVSPYLRTALTFPLGAFDIVTGAWYSQIKIGSYAAAVNGTDSTATQQYGIDLEAQGTIGEISLGFYLPWQFKADQVSKAVGSSDDSWFGIYPVITASSGPIGARFGYDFSRTRFAGQPTKVSSSTKTWMVGAWYAATRNIVFDLEFISKSVLDALGVQGNTEDLSAVTARLEYLY